MTKHHSNTALLIIDVQEGLDHPTYWGKRNNPDAEKNMEALLQAWRAAQRPVIHIQHHSTSPKSPLRPGQSGNNIKPALRPLDTEPLYGKTVNSAFIGTTLETDLHEKGITDLVIVGLTTDHCVSTSTRMAGNLGFNVTLVGDATATFDRTAPDGTYISAETMHQINLASLHDEFCTVKNTAEVLERKQ